MDPDTALHALRQLVAAALNDTDEPEPYVGLGGDAEIDGLRAERDELSAALTALAEQVDALDGWITNGGFMPAGWEPTVQQRNRTALRAESSRIGQ